MSNSGLLRAKRVALALPPSPGPGRGPLEECGQTIAVGFAGISAPSIVVPRTAIAAAGLGF